MMFYHSVTTVHENHISDFEEISTLFMLINSLKWVILLLFYYYFGIKVLSIPYKYVPKRVFDKKKFDIK
ncbi:hypothetical protein QTP88_024348 [Uroleucon formosanum]